MQIMLFVYSVEQIWVFFSRNFTTLISDSLVKHSNLPELLCIFRFLDIGYLDFETFDFIILKFRNYELVTWIQKASALK